MFYMEKLAVSYLALAPGVNVQVTQSCKNDSISSSAAQDMLFQTTQLQIKNILDFKDVH